MRFPTTSRFDNIIPLPDSYLGGIIAGGSAGAVGGAIGVALGGAVASAAGYVAVGVVVGCMMHARRPRLDSWVRAIIVGGAVGAVGGLVAVPFGGGVRTVVGFVAGGVAAGCMVYAQHGRRQKQQSERVTRTAE